MNVNATFGIIAALGFSTLCAPAISQVTYDIDHPTLGVTTATGSFTFDASRDAITSWDITVKGGSGSFHFENIGKQFASYLARPHSDFDEQFSLGHGTYLDLDIGRLDHIEAVQFSSQRFNEECGVSVSAIPEPGSWAMMMAGMAFVGARLRRRANDLAA
jgi:hypothetical protein